MSRTIHLARGDGAAGGLVDALAISRRDVASLRDDLACGPLAALDDLETWRAMRQEFRERLEEAPAKPRNRSRRARYGSSDLLLSSPRRLADADEVVLWLGTGLTDQLALAWTPQFLRAIGGRAETLRIVQFERTIAGAAIPTLGIVSHAEFQNHPAPRPIDHDGLAYLDQAWSALAASDPAALMRFLDQGACPLPCLREALSRMLWRYPDIRSGLNRYETQILASTRDAGPVVARVIGNSIKILFFGGEPCIGDIWLFRRMRRLADPALPHPAVVLTGKRTTMVGTEARLTPTGERFLNGELNFVERNGIEDWVGGVHLDARVGDVWFLQDQRIVRG